MTTLSLILLYFIPVLIGYPIILSTYGKEESDHKKPNWIQYSKYVLRALLFSCIWPLLAVLLIIDRIIERKGKLNSALQEMKDAIYEKSIEDGKLKFWQMGGMGVIHCNEAGQAQ